MLVRCHVGYVPSTPFRKLLEKAIEKKELLPLVVCPKVGHREAQVIGASGDQLVRCTVQINSEGLEEGAIVLVDFQVLKDQETFFLEGQVQYGFGRD